MTSNEKAARAVVELYNRGLVDIESVIDFELRYLGAKANNVKFDKWRNYDKEKEKGSSY